MIVQETRKDKTLQTILKQVRENWPSVKLPDAVSSFYKRRESFCEADGCLMFMDRIVFPQSLQSPVLKQLHVGHPGMQRMKSLARSYVYWPNIDADIEDFVRKCGSCASASKAPVKPIPSTPWSRLHVDYAGPVRGKFFLVIVDAHSK